MSLYAYVGSNPITVSEPLGLDWWDDNINDAMNDYAWDPNAPDCPCRNHLDGGLCDQHECPI